MTALMAVMVVAVVAAAIAYPLWKPGPQAPPDPTGPAATLAALEERKLRLYASIRELGFDYRTDKLEEADYEEEVDRIKAEAVAVVREIDELRRQPPRGSEDLEAEIAALRTRPGSISGDKAPAAPGEVFCTQCGTPAGDGDRFCASCGSQLRTA
jgi:hypothetical protein